MSFKLDFLIDDQRKLITEQAKDSADISMVMCCFHHSGSLLIFLFTPSGLAKIHALHIGNL